MPSKKTLLNVTSRKKRNGMLTWSNTSPTGASQTIARNTAFVNGTQNATFLWQATAMDLAAVSDSGRGNLFVNVAERTSMTCFMRGLSEHIRIQTSSGLPWFHRRICFCSRGISPFNSLVSGDTPVQGGTTTFSDTSVGMERLWANQGVNTVPNTIAAQQEVLFKGAFNTDWNDPIVAPVDTTRVDLKYDKTWVIRSGNASGTLVERKLWHPMNKNLVYNDDESGENDATSYYSTASKQGMGDYYVYDIIQPGIGGTAADLFNIFSNSTLYWHEK